MIAYRETLYVYKPRETFGRRLAIIRFIYVSEYSQTQLRFIEVQKELR